MKLILDTKHVKGYKVKIIDTDGNFEIFDNIRTAAKALGVKTQTLYTAICYGKEVRGCKIEK